MAVKYKITYWTKDDHSNKQTGEIIVESDKNVPTVKLDTMKKIANEGKFRLSNVGITSMEKIE